MAKTAIEAALEGVERLGDTGAQDAARDAVRAVLGFHREGVERMLELVRQGGDAGGAIIDTFANDNLVSNLLALHDLHPIEVDVRVRAALAKEDAALQALGGLCEGRGGGRPGRAPRDARTRAYPREGSAGARSRRSRRARRVGTRSGRAHRLDHGSRRWNEGWPRLPR